MKPEELWTTVDYWNDLQKGDLEAETYIRVGDELAEYAAQLEEENEALRESMLSIAISSNMEGSETLVRANLLRICMIANNHLREEQADET